MRLQKSFLFVGESVVILLLVRLWLLSIFGRQEERGGMDGFHGSRQGTCRPGGGDIGRRFIPRRVVKGSPLAGEDIQLSTDCILPSIFAIHFSLITPSR